MKRFGKPGTVAAEVRARGAVPDVGQRAAVAPADQPADGHVEDLEAGAEDERVDLELAAVGGHDRVLGGTSATPSVTSSTLSRASAGYQSLDGRMRLQPTV